MRFSKSIFISLFIVLLSDTSAFAARLKKVLILDIQNIRHEKRYDYLKESLSEAIRINLKARFAFEESEFTQLKKIASENYIFENDLFTTTAAMNLGLLAKQDLVIYGGFYSSKTKKGKAQIHTTIGIIDTSQRKVLSRFKMKNKIDSKIFVTIDKIASKIIKAAAYVLPNKEDWSRNDNIAEEKLDYYNQLTLYSGFHALALSSENKLKQNGVINPTDLDPSYTLGFEYQRYGVLLNAISFFSQFEYRTVKSNINVHGLEGSVPVKLSGFSGLVGSGYRLDVTKKTYSQIFFLGGLAFNNTSVSYAQSNIKAVNTSGKEESLKDYSSLIPSFKTGIRLGYRLSSWFALELGVNYNFLLYSSNNSQTFSTELRAGFLL